MKIVNKTFEEMEKFLNDPTAKIIDSRMLEFADDFSFTLQVLVPVSDSESAVIFQTTVKPQIKVLEGGETKIVDGPTWRRDVIELFRLQYRNSPRMNPALYGLLDAADAESRVEQTSPIQVK